MGRSRKRGSGGISTLARVLAVLAVWGTSITKGSVSRSAPGSTAVFFEDGEHLAVVDIAPDFSRRPAADQWAELELQSESAGLCAAVYLDTRPSAWPLACMGDGCHDPDDARVRKCEGTSQRAAGVVVNSMESLHVYVHAHAPGRDVMLETKFTDARVVAEGFLEGSPVDVYIGSTLLGPGRAGELGGFADAARKAHIWHVITLTRAVEDGVEFSTVDVSDFVDPLVVDVQTTMVPPHMEVVIGRTTVTPELPAGWMAHHVLAAGGRTVGSTTIPQGDTGTLEISDCAELHELKTSIVSPRGSIMAVHMQVVDPEVYCAAMDRDVRCFCADVQRRRDIPTPEYSVNKLAIPPRGYAVRLSDARRVEDTFHFWSSDDAGEYIVFDEAHEVVGHAIACWVGAPVIRSQADNAGDGVAYLYADPMMVCPPGRRPPDTTIRWFFGDADMDVDDVAFWYPRPGVYTIEATTAGETMESAPLHVADHSDHALIRLGCLHHKASLEANYIPRYTTDHDATATVTVESLDPVDEDGPAEWFVSVDSTPASPQPWLRMRVNPAGAPVHNFKLRAGVGYRARVMRVPVLPEATNLYAGTACYLEAGRIRAMAPPEIFIVQPVEFVQCGPAHTTLYFSVSANIEMTAPPTGARPVALLGVEPGMPGWFVHRFVMTEVDPSDDFSLLFHVGGGHTVLSDKLQRMVAAGMVRAAPDAFPGGDTIHVSSAKEADYIFDGTPQEFSVPFVVPEHVSVSVVDEDGAPMDFARKNTSLVITGASSRPASEETAGVIEARVRISGARILEDFCPTLTVLARVPMFVDVRVTPRLIPPEETDTEVLCYGDRMYDLALAVDPPPWLEIRVTETDARLGAGFPPVRIPAWEDTVWCGVFLSDGKTSLADFPVKLWDLFSDERPWTPRVPSIAAAPYAAPKCMRNVDGYPEVELAIDVRDGDADGVVLLGVSAVDEDDTPFHPPAETRRIAGGTRYLFSGLPLGHYQATAQATTDGLMCATTTHHFLGHDTSAYAVLDKQTKSGATSMHCPADLYGGANVWQEYFDLVFTPYFAARWITRDETVETKAKMYRVANGEFIPPANANAPRVFEHMDGLHVASYKLPEPGEYIPRVDVRDTTMECVFYFPGYTVNEPMWTPDEFRLVVDEYPTCATDTDGYAHIEVPPAAGGRVSARIRHCVPWQGEDCLDALSLADIDSAGHIALEGVGLARKIVVEFDVAGECSFEREFSTLPPAGAYPLISRLEYLPSCERRHTVRALYVHPRTGIEVPLVAPADYVWTRARTRIGGDRAGPEIDLLSEDIGGARLTLHATYKGRAGASSKTCTSSASLTVPEDDVPRPPKVEIEAPLPGTQSLPVFCPGGEDAVLRAMFDPPIRNGVDVFTWSSETAQANSEVVHGEAVVAHGLSAGLYELNYTRMQPGGLACSDVARVVVPEKKHFVAESHISIESARCAGGTASARLVEDGGDSHCGLEPEFERFSAKMVAPDERTYIADAGYGTTEIVGVPGGTSLHIRVPYPDSYAHHAGSFCAKPLVLDFPDTAPIPVFVNTPVVDCGTGRAALSVHVPPRHAVVDIQWLTGHTEVDVGHGAIATLALDAPRYKVKATDIHTGCTQVGEAPLASRLRVAGSDALDVVRYAANPRTQVVCPSDWVAMVNIDQENLITGETKSAWTDFIFNQPGGSHVRVVDAADGSYRNYTYVSWGPGSEGKKMLVECGGRRDGVEYVVTRIAHPETSVARLEYSESCGSNEFLATFDLTEWEGAPTRTLTTCWDANSLSTLIHTTYTPTKFPDSRCKVFVHVDADTQSRRKNAPEFMFIVQGDGLPLQDVPSRPVAIGVRDIDVEPVPVEVYVTGATTLGHVTVETLGPRDVVADSVDYFLARRSGNDVWTHAADVTLEPGHRYRISVDSGSDIASYSGHDLDPVVVGIAKGQTINVDCSVVRHASTPHSADGIVAVDITGGISPFTLIWQELDYTRRAEGRYHTQEYLEPGQYTVTVFQENQPISAGVGAVCHMQVGALRDFRVGSVVVESAEGCAAQTVARIRVEVVGAARVHSFGWWDAGESEPDIDSCDDARMSLDFDVAVDGVSPVAVVGPGAWHFAVCDRPGSLVHTHAPTPVRALEDNLVIKSTRAGEVCGDSTKVYPALAVTGARDPGSLRAVDVATGAIIPTVWQTSSLDLDLGVGLWQVEVSEPLSGCAVRAEISVTDTGLNACGSCLAPEEDTSCYGCDGVPNSGLTTDICGVCGGDDACIHDCATSNIQPHILPELVWCADKLRDITLTGDLLIPPPQVQYPHLGLISVSRDRVTSTSPIRAHSVSLSGIVIPTGKTLIFDAHIVTITDAHILGTLVGGMPPTPPVISIRDSYFGPESAIVLREMDSVVTPTPVSEPTALRSRRRRREADPSPSPGGMGGEPPNPTMEVRDCEGTVVIVGPDGRMEIEANATGKVTFKYGFGNGTLVLDPESGVERVDISGVVFPEPRTDLMCQMFLDVASLKVIEDGGEEWTRRLLRDNKRCDGALDKDDNDKTGSVGFILYMIGVGMILLMFLLFLLSRASQQGAAIRAAQQRVMLEQYGEGGPS